MKSQTHDEYVASLKAAKTVRPPKPPELVVDPNGVAADVEKPKK